MGNSKSVFGTAAVTTEKTTFACPNCWGKQSYEGKFVEVINDRLKSNIHREKGYKKTFIQAFVERNITGVR